MYDFSVEITRTCSIFRWHWNFRICQNIAMQPTCKLLILYSQRLFIKIGIIGKFTKDIDTFLIRLLGWCLNEQAMSYLSFEENVLVRCAPLFRWKWACKLDPSWFCRLERKARFVYYEISL